MYFIPAMYWRQKFKGVWASRLVVVQPRAARYKSGAGRRDKNVKFILVKTRLAGRRGELFSAPTTGFPNEHMYLKLWYI